MKRWWGIRHIRWMYYSWRFWDWWERFGRHMWLTPNEADLIFLDAVKNGAA